jgi:excinuclease ABC subunit C
MSSTISKKLKSLPFSPGVYIFKDKAGVVLYVGKATSLKDRVGSYFTPSPQSSLDYGRGGNRPIEIKISAVDDFEIKKTDTVIEAYILEQKLIKDLQPKYNVDGKDDRSFCYILITKEDYPRFIIMRKTEVSQIFNFQFSIFNKFSISKFSKKLPYTKIYGPYTSRK